MKDAYERKLKAQLDEWDAEIDRLKARAEKAQADGEVEFHRQVERLREDQRAAQKRLDELRNASESAWEDMRAGMDSAWDSLRSAVKSASSRFD